MAKTATGKKKAATNGTKRAKIDFHRDYRPGKGLSMSLDTLERLFKLSDFIDDLYLDGERTEAQMESMLKRAFGDPIEVDLKYGKKWLVDCFESRANNEFRICVVLRGETVRIDAREWYNPNKD